MRNRHSLLWALVALWLTFAAGASAAAEAPKLALLGAADADRYARIFDLQDAGDFAAADRLIAGLKSKLLLGHVQFQRYMHPTDYKSRFGELRDWLDRYNDLPEAFRVFSLAMKRRPGGAARPKLPVHGEEHIRELVGEPPRPSAPYVGPAERAAGAVRKAVSKGDNAGAERLLNAHRRTLKRLQWDELAGLVAMGYFVDGDDENAFRLGAAAADRSGRQAPLAHWAAGLAAFRAGKLKAAASQFEAYSKGEKLPTGMQAAGGYWAARAHTALGDPKQAQLWLAFAGQYERTFYGQLALYALKASSPFDWKTPAATPSDLARLKGSKAGERALALLQIGERWRADQELQPLVETAEPEALRSLLATALSYGAPRTAVHAAFRLNKEFGEYAPAGFYPIAPWTPAPELEVDRALAFAFMRQESQFNPRAASPAGARGLMQIMPATANYIVGEERYVRARRDGLFDPEQSIDLGARYIRYLLAKDAVAGDLFRLAIAYNGGIGNLGRWLEEVRYNDDPLLFIEAIPSRETRAFVERTMANLWIYRQRLGQPATSLVDVAEGRWPRYEKQD